VISNRRAGAQWMALGFLLLGGTILLRAQDAPEVPDTDQSPYHQALLNYKSGHYDAARTAVDAAEKANPGDISTEILKARILTEQHDYTQGEALLRRLLTPTGPLEVQLALGDLLLREGHSDRASKFYEAALQAKPDDPDIMLKLIYARISVSDLITAEKYASQLKPLDPDHPSYYFAKAALAQATGKTQEAEDNIQTARTIYGITATNRYLKLYLEVFAAPQKNSTASEITPPPLLKPAATNSAP
jgi:tetratricopeptide (TPR) repeat protein